MKNLLLFTALLLSCATFAQSTSRSRTTKVKGYTKKDGTYVAPHTRTKSNKTQYDNYSTKGNYNPNTGKSGTRRPKK